MPVLVDTSACAATALVLAGRTLSALVSKGLLADEEALQIIRQTADEISSGDADQKAACRVALKAIFPLADF